MYTSTEHTNLSTLCNTYIFKDIFNLYPCLAGNQTNIPPSPICSPCILWDNWIDSHLQLREYCPIYILFPPPPPPPFSGSEQDIFHKLFGWQEWLQSVEPVPDWLGVRVDLPWFFLLTPSSVARMAAAPASHYPWWRRRQRPTWPPASPTLSPSWWQSSLRVITTTRGSCAISHNQSTKSVLQQQPKYIS